MTVSPALTGEIIKAFEVMVMDKKLLNRLMLISIVGLISAAVIFICVYIFGQDKNNSLLMAAMGCNVLAGIFFAVKENTINKKGS